MACILSVLFSPYGQAHMELIKSKLITMEIFFHH